mgnify:CR=1 FL=1
MISWDSLMLETLDKHARAIVCDKAMSINPNDFVALSSIPNAAAQAVSLLVLIPEILLIRSHRGELDKKKKVLLESLATLEKALAKIDIDQE